MRVAQGVQRLEALQGYVDKTIKEQATDVLDTYFQESNSGESEGETEES